MGCLEDQFRSLLTAAMSSFESRDPDNHHAPAQDDVTNDAEDDLSSRGGGRRRTSSKYRSKSSILELDLIPDQTVADLRLIAKQMVAAGYIHDCIQAYASVRKPELELGLRKLGIEKLSIGEVQKLEWESLERKIRRWLKGAKVCVRILFASEKRLCQQIFEGLGDGADQSRNPEINNADSTEADDMANMCFMETVKPFAVEMFDFAEAISISRRAPRELFKILDLYETLTDLLPDIEVVFDSMPSESIKVQVAEILTRLTDAATEILSEFENKILREPSTVLVPGGTIHPLTRYVMNYINLISDYKQTMSELITSKPLWYSDDSMGPDMDLDELENKAPLCVHLIWIIVILQSNIECKSKHYKDPSLSHLFLMNNVHYIVMKIKGSPELMEMIGDNCLKKLTGKYRQAATGYQRSTWVRVLYCLRDKGLHVNGGFSSGVSKRALKERFKAFNAMFDEVHRVQTTWIVPDNQLREELRLAISEILIPAYRSFLGRFRGYIESGRHPEAYIRYSVDDLENFALDFFDDSQGSQHSSRISES